MSTPTATPTESLILQAIVTHLRNDPGSGGYWLLEDSSIAGQVRGIVERRVAEATEFWRKDSAAGWDACEKRRQEAERLAAALTEIRTAGNDSAQTHWMQKVAANALEPGRWPHPGKQPLAS